LNDRRRLALAPESDPGAVHLYPEDVSDSVTATPVSMLSGSREDPMNIRLSGFVLALLAVAAVSMVTATGGRCRRLLLRDGNTVAVVTLPASALRLPTPADRPAVRALSA
jgi:hypothetical protein